MNKYTVIYLLPSDLAYSNPVDLVVIRRVEAFSPEHAWIKCMIDVVMDEHTDDVATLPDGYDWEHTDIYDYTLDDVAMDYALVAVFDGFSQNHIN